MGTWGVALFSDDIASDLREDFRDLIADGLTTESAVEKLIIEYEPDRDPDIEPVFWLALAATQWRLGRLEERTKQRALTIITNGKDLDRWDDEKLKKKRETVLTKIKMQLLTPPPAPKKISKRFIASNDWEVGEIIGFQLASKKWILLRIIGHHTDKGGRSAVCEPLDWVGDTIPEYKLIRKLGIKQGVSPYYPSQFFFQEARNKKQLERIRRTGIICTPKQKLGGYCIIIWQFIDKQLKDMYGFE